MILQLGTHSCYIRRQSTGNNVTSRWIAFSASSFTPIPTNLGTTISQVDRTKSPYSWSPSSLRPSRGPIGSENPLTPSTAFLPERRENGRLFLAQLAGRTSKTSIGQAKNLELGHFSCRYLIMEDLFIPLCESILLQVHLTEEFELGIMIVVVDRRDAWVGLRSGMPTQLLGVLLHTTAMFGLSRVRTESVHLLVIPFIAHHPEQLNG